MAEKITSSPGLSRRADADAQRRSRITHHENGSATVVCGAEDDLAKLFRQIFPANTEEGAEQMFAAWLFAELGGRMPRAGETVEVPEYPAMVAAARAVAPEMFKAALACLKDGVTCTKNARVRRQVHQASQAAARRPAADAMAKPRGKGVAAASRRQKIGGSAAQPTAALRPVPAPASAASDPARSSAFVLSLGRAVLEHAPLSTARLPKTVAQRALEHVSLAQQGQLLLASASLAALKRDLAAAWSALPLTPEQKTALDELAAAVVNQMAYNVADEAAVKPVQQGLLNDLRIGKASLELLARDQRVAEVVAGHLARQSSEEAGEMLKAMGLDQADLADSLRRRSRGEAGESLCRAARAKLDEVRQLEQKVRSTVSRLDFFSLCPERTRRYLRTAPYGLPGASFPFDHSQVKNAAGEAIVRRVAEFDRSYETYVIAGLSFLGGIALGPLEAGMLISAFFGGVLMGTPSLLLGVDEIEKLDLLADLGAASQKEVRTKVLAVAAGYIFDVATAGVGVKLESPVFDFASEVAGVFIDQGAESLREQLSKKSATQSGLAARELAQEHLATLHAQLERQWQSLCDQHQLSPSQDRFTRALDVYGVLFGAYVPFLALRGEQPLVDHFSQFAAAVLAQEQGTATRPVLH